MGDLPPNVMWFVSLYSVHFGLEFPESAINRLERTTSLMLPLFGDYVGPILTYILTRGWDRDDPEDIGRFVDRIYDTVYRHIDFLESLWPITEEIFGHGVREEDKRTRAFAELIMSLMDGADFDRESAICFLRDLSAGL